MKIIGNRIKRQTTDWETLFVNHISEKGFVSGICEDLSNLNSKTRNSPFRKLAKREQTDID